MPKKEHLKLGAPTLMRKRAAVVVGVTDAEVLADVEKEKAKAAVKRELAL